MENFTNGDIKDTIRRVDWQVGLEGLGVVKQGADSVSQSILIAISTIRGSDPFRPRFGSGIWDHVDKPLAIAAPLMVSEIRSSVSRYVTNIVLDSVSYTLESSQNNEVADRINFAVNWSLEGNSSQARTDIALGVNQSGSPSDLSTPSEAVSIEVIGTETFGNVIQIT